MSMSIHFAIPLELLPESVRDNLTHEFEHFIDSGWATSMVDVYGVRAYFRINPHKTIFKLPDDKLPLFLRDLRGQFESFGINSNIGIFKGQDCVEQFGKAYEDSRVRFLAIADKIRGGRVDLFERMTYWLHPTEDGFELSYVLNDLEKLV